MSRFRVMSFKKSLFVGLPVTLVLVLVACVYWLLYTASAAAWLWNQLEGNSTIYVRSSQVTGDLATGIVIQNLEYRSGNLDLTVRRAEIEAGPGGWPVAIKVRRLLLQDVKITTRSDPDAARNVNEDMDFRTTLAAIELPVPMEIENAVLTNIILQNDDNPEVSLFESIRFKAALDEQLVVDQLDILAAGLETGLKGHLTLEPPFELDAVIAGRFEKIGESGEAVFVFPFELEGSGNLDKVQISLSSPTTGLQLDGEVVDPVIKPEWNITAVVAHLLVPPDVISGDLVLSGLNLASRGNISDWSFTLDSGVQFDGLQQGLFSVAGSGSATGVKINNATLTGTGLDLDFNGSLDWSAQPGVASKVVIRQLDLTPWLQDWPAGQALAGELEFGWSGSGLKIPSGRLTVSGTDLSVGIEADIDIENNRVNARLDWSNLSWPLQETAADFSSQSGQLSISGSIENWLASGQLEIQVGDYPPGHFEVQGSGDQTSTRLLIPGGEILGGTLSGEVDADWARGLNWNAAIKTRGINPEPLLPGWPGRLDSEFEINAQSPPQKILINIVALQGLLRGVPITAHGGLHITDAGLTFKALEIDTDEAELALNGATTEAAGVTVKFSGSLPSALLQGASGSLELDGRYSSHVSQSLLAVNMQAHDLAWNGLSLSKLTVSTPETQTAGPVPAIKLDASGIVFNDLQLDELSMAFSPLGEQHELTARLVSEKVVLSSVMTLKPENQREPLNGAWQGLLDKLEVSVGQAYGFGLVKPAAFVWSAGSISLGPACLREVTAASLCLDLDYQRNGDWSVVADATAVPLNYLRDILDLDIDFEQLFEGHFEWHQTLGQAPSGGAEFRITAGRITDLLDNQLLAETNEGRFGFILQNGNLESGDLDVELPGTGFIDVDFKVLDIVGDTDPEIQGRVLARLDRFKLIGQLLFPGLDALEGQFESDIQLGGNLADPDFDGGFKFSNGLIHYDPIGVKLEDINLDGHLKKGGRGDFKGQFRAGEGIASLDGKFLFDDIESLQLEVAIAGDELLLVDSKNLKIFAETELEIAFNPERMNIFGHITIPKASLTPENLLLGEVKDSEDLIIETPGAKVEPVAAEQPAKQQVYGQLEVTFGDDVFIKIPGIETRLHGSTLFNWSGDPIPMAKGSYLLKGKVDFYGPTLVINNGTISFPGVPADNPLLNIRAGREIFGNTQIRTAGVQLIGNLKRPVLEAYTVPVTNEDRAWTLLLTGTDFDPAQGVGGFNVGTYIAPRLYVSYGISLFEDGNVISARYDLKKGLGVKVTSGQRETGVDMSYTLDK